MSKNEGFREILKIIAQENGVTAEEVEREMQAAISVGFSNSDPEVRKEWEKMGFTAEPSAEDLVKGLAAKMADKRENE